jgi:predicted ribosomally synthesized peptide with SipW-like signal peptide
MKKIRNILGSVVVIAAVAALGYVGTTAYFSDTEISDRRHRSGKLGYTTAL